MKRFLPEDYEAPKTNSGGYMKLQDGDNKFRVLSEAVTGYELWTVENKPLRFSDYPKSMPANVRPDSKVKHFWAFVVWNYADEAVQILEITQATIRDQIHEYYKMAEYGEPTGYYLKITRKGESLDTSYSVQALPPKAMPSAAEDAYKAKTINLDALFDGGNPFEDASDIGVIFNEEETELIKDYKFPPPPPSLQKVGVKKSPTI